MNVRVKRLKLSEADLQEVLQQERQQPVVEEILVSSEEEQRGRKRKRTAKPEYKYDSEESDGKAGSPDSDYQAEEGLGEEMEDDDVAEISEISEEEDEPPRKRSRRSRREREGSSEEEVQPRRGTRKRKERRLAESESEEEVQCKQGTKKRVERKRRVVEAASDDSSDYQGPTASPPPRGKNKKSKKKAAMGSTTGRARAKVQYVQTSSEEEEEAEMTAGERAAARAAAQVEGDGVDRVCDHREGRAGATGDRTKYHVVQEQGDPNTGEEAEEERETQYLIKWQGRSHLHNTWQSEQSMELLATERGKTDPKARTNFLRKLVNYQNSLAEYKTWKKRASQEDVEYAEIDIEHGKQMLTHYREIDRIFSRKRNEEDTGYEVYCKWRDLPYLDATWEEEDFIKKYYKVEYDTFKKRKKAKADPKDYKASMKSVKKKFTRMEEQPDYLGSEELRLRDYQLDGVNFVLNAWHRGRSLILADEMGLGKTIQTISFFQYIFHNYLFKGPMLVCVPLSTMPAWQKEFGQWAPNINTITYTGDARSRQIIREFECENENGEISFNAILTSYEMVWKDRTFFEDIVWSNIVVDEAHRLKNEGSLLYKGQDINIECHKSNQSFFRVKENIFCDYRIV